MNGIESGEIVLRCSSLDEMVTFFKDQLSFRVDVISPADDPSTMILSGYGLRIRLERDSNQSNSILRLFTNEDHQRREFIAPNGTTIEIVKSSKDLFIPSNDQSFVLTRMNENSQWIKGRAGMNYRDLIPGRQGGRFIASHIHIPDGGTVNDHVHYHHIRFQMIYVYHGWVRLLYEDQGEEFVLHAGDCVLQPPLIRHRVLESSPGLQVIEIACPSVHDTFFDHQMKLPNTNQPIDRVYEKQRFVKYIVREDQNEWKPWRLSGFESREMGIDRATDGLAAATIIRRTKYFQPQQYQHKAEFVFIFVLQGQLSFRIDEQIIENLTNGDAFVLPENHLYSFTHSSDDLQLLEVSLPANFSTISQ